MSFKEALPMIPADLNARQRRAEAVAGGTSHHVYEQNARRAHFSTYWQWTSEKIG